MCIPKCLSIFSEVLSEETGTPLSKTLWPIGWLDLSEIVKLYHKAAETYQEFIDSWSVLFANYRVWDCSLAFMYSFAVPDIIFDSVTVLKKLA